MKNDKKYYAQEVLKRWGISPRHVKYNHMLKQVQKMDMITIFALVSKPIKTKGVK